MLSKHLLLLLIFLLLTLVGSGCRPTPVRVVETVVVERTVVVYWTPTVLAPLFHSSIIPPPIRTVRPSPTPAKTRVKTTHTSTPTRTATPTYTPGPPHTPLPIVLGFQDKYIARLEGAQYRLVDQADVEVDRGTYAAYLLNPPYEHAEGRRVLIYRHTKDRSPELLFDSGSSRYPIAVGISDWNDANQDGRPDLIISYDCLCNGVCGHWSDAVQIEAASRISLRSTPICTQRASRKDWSKYARHMASRWMNGRPSI